MKPSKMEGYIHPAADHQENPGNYTGPVDGYIHPVEKKEDFKYNSVNPGVDGYMPKSADVMAEIEKLAK